MKKVLIILGIVFIVFSILLMFEPYYTYSQAVNSYNSCQIDILNEENAALVLENLNPGDEYINSITIIKTGEATSQLFFYNEVIVDSLSPKLNLKIFSLQKKYYDGSINELPSSLLIESEFKHNDTLVIYFVVTLPKDTPNYFQGNSVNMWFSFYTQCSGNELELTPDDPLVVPPDFPLPRTDGSVLWIFFIGIVLVLIGIKIIK